MRIKSLLLIAALCGAFVSATAEKKDAKGEELGVHPYKETKNMAWETTGFSLVFHGGVNFWLGDYPTDNGNFTNFGYPSAGLALEYNFTPVWGLGFGYNFAMPQVKNAAEINGREFDNKGDLKDVTIPAGSLMYRSMMHSGQVYVTFNIINAWFPRAVSDIFALGLYAGFGGTLYHNTKSHKDTGETYDDGRSVPAGKYVEVAEAKDENGKDKYEMAGFIPVGVSAEFNVSRNIAIGARAQGNLFLNDYLDDRYMDKANKRNDGMIDLELMLRWKINAKKKNHVKNVASYEVMEEKYYESHPTRRKRPHVVDTLVVYHRDTIVVVHRDTIVAVASAPVVEQPRDLAPQNTGRCDLTLYPGWEAEADAVVVEGQSLSQLARKYYNNTFCWVYLWIANRSIAPDPNLIMPKCVLKVPRLNACQKSITKQEAKDMCAELRAKE